MNNNTRSQRLINEFHEGSTWHGGFSIRHGLAWVLRHLADTEADYINDESCYAVSVNVLTDLANDLNAPSLLDRALAGDKQAARQFLLEEGFIDGDGNLLLNF